MRGWMLAGAVVLSLVSGCASPQGTHDVGSLVSAEHPQSVGTVPVVNVTLSGVVLFRAPGTGPIPGEGNEASFCFDLPDNTTRLAGHLTWSPPQSMGLEFHGPRREDYYASWDGTSQNGTPPVDLTVQDPVAGRWFSYAGPGVVGGGVAWTLELVVTGSPGSQPWDGKIYPEGSRLDPNSGCF